MRVALRCTKFNREANSVEIDVLRFLYCLIVVVVVVDLKEVGILINLDSEIFCAKEQITIEVASVVKINRFILGSEIV